MDIPIIRGGKILLLTSRVMSDPTTGGRRYWWLVLRQVGVRSNVYKRVGLGYFQVLRRSFYLFDGASLETIKLI